MASSFWWLTVIRWIRSKHCWIRWSDFQAFVEFVGTLSEEWELESMKDLLLVNLKGKYTNNCAGNVLGLMYSYHKPFHFEEQVVDPDIHFNYIKAAAKTGQIKV